VPNVATFSTFENPASSSAARCSATVRGKESWTSTQVQYVERFGSAHVQLADEGVEHLKATRASLSGALPLPGIGRIAQIDRTGNVLVDHSQNPIRFLDIRRRKGARASAFAAALAHAGLGISLMGVAGTTAWRSEALTVLAPGQTMTVGPYTLRFDGVTEEKGPNYFADRAHLALMDGGSVKAMLLPERRYYPAEGLDKNETAIRTTGLRDLYLALGDDRGGGRFAFRAYVSPLAPLIWLGGLVMALGGILSLWGRIRVREIEPKPAAPSVALAAE